MIWQILGGICNLIVLRKIIGIRFPCRQLPTSPTSITSSFLCKWSLNHIYGQLFQGAKLLCFSKALLGGRHQQYLPRHGILQNELECFLIEATLEGDIADLALHVQLGLRVLVGELLSVDFLQFFVPVVNLIYLLGSLVLTASRHCSCSLSSRAAWYLCATRILLGSQSLGNFSILRPITIPILIDSLALILGLFMLQSLI